MKFNVYVLVDNIAKEVIQTLHSKTDKFAIKQLQQALQKDNFDISISLYKVGEFEVDDYSEKPVVFNDSEKCDSIFDFPYEKQDIDLTREISNEEE